MGKIDSVNTYGRFWSAFGQLPFKGDREVLKRQLVAQFTCGRTESLKEMGVSEYRELCAHLEAETGLRDAIRRERSTCLKLMGEAGVETSNWSRVNLFCQDRRIAGKAFARLSLEELRALEVKLRAIGRKGGLPKRRDSSARIAIPVQAKGEC